VGLILRNSVRSAFVIGLLALMQSVTLYVFAGVHDTAARKGKKHSSATTSSGKRAASSKSKGTSTTKGKAGKRTSSGKAARSKGRPAGRRKGRRIASVETAQSRKLTSAFVASAQLRPMAQQLAVTRSPAAYAGVRSYAGAHTSEASSAAYLALGHAYQADHRYAEAFTAYREAARQGQALDDYADYLAAQAAMQSNNSDGAISLLNGFAARYP